MENIENPVLCGPCQTTISNFANEFDLQKFQNHCIEDRTELQDTSICCIEDRKELHYSSVCTFSTLSVKLLRDQTIDCLCKDLNAKKGNQNEKNKHAQLGIEEGLIKLEIPVKDSEDDR